jgi:glycerol-3-phosphate acyltransferase PlsY
MSASSGRDALAVVLSYLLGAIPFSYLIARCRSGIDIRERGEGNAGARNVFHVVGPAWGVLAAILDMGKGLAAYHVAYWLAISPAALLAAGFAAPLGHGFSPFLRFRGGKGVATATGFILGLLPFSTLSGVLVFGLVYAVARDANKALMWGVLAAIVLPPLFGAPLAVVPYVLCLYLTLGVKKMLDRAHERAVWSRDPWANGQPGFHGESQAGAEHGARDGL